MQREPTIRVEERALERALEPTVEPALEPTVKRRTSANWRFHLPNLSWQIDLPFDLLENSNRKHPAGRPSSNFKEGAIILQSLKFRLFALVKVPLVPDKRHNRPYHSRYHLSSRHTLSVYHTPFFGGLNEFAFASFRQIFFHSFCHFAFLKEL